MNATHVHRVRIVLAAVALVAVVALLAARALHAEPPFVPFISPLGVQSGAGGSGGGGGSGTVGPGVAGEVAFFTAATQVQSDSAFLYNSATDILTLEGQQRIAPAVGTLHLAPLEIDNGDGGSPFAGVVVAQHSAAPATYFAGYSSRGTHTTPTATQSGDMIVEWTGAGRAATSYAFSPSIQMRATEAWTNSAFGSQILFRTVANLTTSQTTVMTITQDARVGIKTSGPTAVLEVAAGTLASNVQALGVTAVLPAVANQLGAYVNVTGSAGVVGTQGGAFQANVAAGYTGSGLTYGIFTTNNSAGTGATSMQVTNVGIFANTVGATTGINVGVRGGAASSTGINIGLLGQPGDNSATSASDVGVFGNVANPNATTKTAGYFRLRASDDTAVPTFVTAALVADGGDTASNIFVAKNDAGANCTMTSAGAFSCTGAISGSGSLTGSGANTRIAFWTGASTLSSDANFTWNTGTGTMLIGTTGTGATTLEVAGTLTVSELAGVNGNIIYDRFVALAAAKRQAVACAAGVLALTPTRAYIDIDANGAACVVTLSESGALLGSDVTISIVTSAGAGVVTFPDVANVHVGPTLCTTTGLTINGVYTITYVDKANDAWLGKTCLQNS